MNRRRGHNEGSIYKRPDGRWVAVLNLGWEGGKRKRKYLYGKTRQEVQKKLTRALHDAEHGVMLRDERQTVAAFFSRWLAESVKPSVRPSTYRSYEQLTRLHIVPEIGHIRLSKLSPADVQSLLNRKLAAGLSPASVARIRAVIRIALGQALRWELVSRNVATLVDPPRLPKKEPAFLDPDQIKRLLEAAREDRLYALYLLAVTTGMRQGELLGLRWSDVDLDRGTLTIRYALQRGQLVEPKTERSRRTLPLPPFVVSALRAHRLAQKQEARWGGTAWQDTDFVFTSVVGTPLDASNLRRFFHRLLKRAGLPPVRFHDLRHSCASYLIAQGVQPRVIMELLGHSQISLTMNTYGHIIPAAQHEAARIMEGLLQGQERP